MKIHKIKNYICNNFPESEGKLLNNQYLNLKKNKNQVNLLNYLDNDVFNPNIKRSINLPGKIF